MRKAQKINKGLIRNDLLGDLKKNDMAKQIK